MDDKRRLILDQALALVDERGLAAMSMRAVAERVGLTSMALYPYVGGKDALLDGLVDLLHLELGSAYGADPAGIDWRQRLRALGRAVRELSRRHPAAYPLLLNRPSPGGSWLTAALRGTLHDAGVPAAEVPRLTRMICAFLLGYTTGEVTGGLPPGRPAEPEPDPSSSSSSSSSEPPPPPPSPSPAGSPSPPSSPLPAEPPSPASPAEPASLPGPGLSADAEFDADLDDLIRLVEVTVRVA
ncbi:TetR/AcrR family transcriptional regulator [Couchioplanes azureus]|uniref:TetR/AcrR family transcriptional regulator n=1 Tax=Couchioplanes caeruleus TaxID=56438 RepID=UPI001E5170F9|nr:TetR family transcriptional regulator [Couchioplanes caeruleus]